MLRIILVATFSWLLNPVFAQETDHSEEIYTQESEQKNFVAFFVGNTIIAQSKYQMPTIGVEYIRELNHRIGVGLMAEWEIGSHIIQKNELGDVIAEVDRSSAFLLLPSIFFRVYKGLTITAGYGVEFEKDENLALSKVGIEYLLKMHNPRWAILPSVSWDHTKLFDGVVYGVTAGYSL
ncbi:hypothetical protein MNBD_UNCLBAC01-2166 [hydrothermal vent metagenome]|uniref:Outer membrane protein beta-barrel domain-containing protein n=1 Tax=hydrothermal vent metagenome TaxID=652676 RepID=A0A3B1DE27_9ZZZZ